MKNMISKKILIILMKLMIYPKIMEEMTNKKDEYQLLTSIIN